MGDDPQSKNESRKKILARRASFVAAAMASLAADGCGKTDATRDAGVEIAPRPCLEATPVPCLSVATVESAPPPPPPAPSPQPCLTPVRRENKGAKANCVTPFTIDANGEKRPKPECL